MTQDQIKTIAEEIETFYKANWRIVLTFAEKECLKLLITRHLAEQPDKSLDEICNKSLQDYAVGHGTMGSYVRQACLDYAAKVTKERDDACAIIACKDIDLAAVKIERDSLRQQLEEARLNADGILRQFKQSEQRRDALKIAIRALTDSCDIAQRERDSLRQQLEEAKEQLESALNPIHSCGDNCQRAACVLRRHLAAERKVSDELAWMLKASHGECGYSTCYVRAALTAHQQLRKETNK